MAGGLGFEPRLEESESSVLPLDDPPRTQIKGRTGKEIVQADCVNRLARKSEAAINVHFSLTVIVGRSDVVAFA